MYQAFDPYHKWLGILPKDQPPHHYRLLGLVVFESDPDVIDNAADSRMAQLRMYQTGEHAAESQALLNEIAAARICLLDPARKTMYDRQLRQQLATQEAAQPLPPVRSPGVAAAHTASSGQAPYTVPAGGSHIVPAGGFHIVPAGGSHIVPAGGANVMPVGGTNAIPQGVPTAIPMVPSAIPVGSPGAVPQATPVATPAVPVAAPADQMPAQHEAPPIYSVRRRQPGLSQSVTVGLVLATLLGVGIAAVFLLGGFSSFSGSEKPRPRPVYYETP